MSASKSQSRSASRSTSRRASQKTSRPAPRAAQPSRTPTAATADKYDLYQASVQAPDFDVGFLAGLYRRRRGKPAHHLREDFSGTGLLASTWVKRGPRYTAAGYDIDPEPVSWGMEHNVAPLGKGASRVRFHLQDVRTPSAQRPDVRVALNFSYFVFKQRSELLEYFRAVHDDLDRDGLFVLDIYGGPEAFHELEETRPVDRGFTYVWDQSEYWPATGHYKTYIHFRFRDGSEMRRAFTYDWRLWGLPELKDVLADAGFRSIDSYWEGTAPDGNGGNGVYRKSRRGENCMAWVTYLACWK